MAEYLDHREEKLAQARVLFHKLPEARQRSVAKELMIALGFGGGFAKLDEQGAAGHTLGFG